MSAVKRRSTVHDLASLRLHPDGTRVANTERNTRPRQAKNATKDSRGNWIARDAGGLGQVKQRRAARPEQGGGGEEQVDGNGEGDEVRRSSKAKGKQRAREEDGEVDEDVLRDPRAKRRKHFQADFNFWDPARVHGGDPEELLLPPFQPAVSFPTSVSLLSVLLESKFTEVSLQDLLKCIHYFASTYYSNMGQLRNDTREYRKEKKQRRLKRLSGKGTGSVPAPKEGSPRPNRSKTQSEGSSSSSEQEAEGSENEEGDTTATAGRPKHKRAFRRARTESGTDMYKIFDGSALVAIGRRSRVTLSSSLTRWPGMLLQEHVTDLLSTRIPDGWEEAMAKTESRTVPEEKRKGKAGRPKKVRCTRVSEEEGITEGNDEEIVDDAQGNSDSDDGDFIPQWSYLQS
ncbi:hypothetical protein PHLCEN_2v7441 [Hermanssonia centrifuga]|uniref:Uncharacterized protein n=1 Tax=Hermanssonia centrifuga TaxID=98765 RepID=A0A2R6NWP5_9APHY|nr:hypothetical protein PHLCEN_2v7441 [Hermanssonia centrifuga]